VSLLLRLFGNFSFAQELMPGKVGMISGLFFGFAFGMGGLGSALLGYLADQTSIEYVYKISSYLPLIGIFTYFNIKRKLFPLKFSFIYEYPWFIS
jgi:FSR family fosmidomycin resistance protein-like MFS transporter